MSSLPPFSDAGDRRATARRSARDIEAELDRLLDPVLSARRTAAPLAQPLESLSGEQQEFVLHWARVAARTNLELSYQFVAAAPNALSAMDASYAEPWIVDALDVYDREGLHRATEVLLQPSVVGVERATGVVQLDEITQVLSLFLRGLSGRHLQIDIAPEPYTDTETLYLPRSMARAPTAHQNFFLYKATAVLLWGQTRFGTFNIDLEATCAQFPDPQRALQLFGRLELVRLECRLSQTLPRLAQEMRTLRGGTPLDARCAPLLDPHATAVDTKRVLESTYDAPPILCDPYGIVLEPARAAARRDARIRRQKSELRTALAQLEDGAYEAGSAHDTRYSLEVGGQETFGDEACARYSLQREGEAVTVKPELAQLIESIIQDIGRVPADYLTSSLTAEDEHSAREHVAADAGVTGEAPVYLYNEWDHLRRHYRKNWCALRERDSPAGDAEFVPATLDKYAGKIAQLRRTFELMRGEERLLKRQRDGDGLDLDALIEARADMHAGSELPSLVFTRRLKHDRDLAVMFMVDMSGSTKGWINLAEREALVMLCEALEVLGDRYAIYGFSGMTRRRCEIFRIKRFDEPYGPTVQQRIAGVQPQDYTRMGAAIRHLTTLLNAVQARTKLLVTLSDGKPDDYSDEYRGQYGVEDTRQALIEAHRSGIKPFCITIDNEARDYLPHMYGSVNWTLVDDVAHLPLRVAAIYQRLTR